MEQADLEGMADALYAAAGLEPDVPVAPLALAARLLGSTAVCRVTGLRTPAALARVGDDWRIYLRRGLTDRAVAWLVAHELAEWALRREGYLGEDIEDLADRLGACVRAPRRAVVWALRHHGHTPAAIAAAFRTSESSAALRIGEVTGAPLALLAPRKAVRVRGESWCWPDAAQILRLARTHGTRLGDDPRRLLLTVGD